MTLEELQAKMPEAQRKAEHIVSRYGRTLANQPAHNTLLRREQIIMASYNWYRARIRELTTAKTKTKTTTTV